MIKNYYDEYWKFEKLEKSEYFHWLKRKLSEFELTGDTYLDIGCGDGFITSSLSNRFETYGIDISNEALKQATKLGIKTELVDLNYSKLKYKDDFFDLVTCFEVLEHVFSPIEILAEIKRVLKPQGVLVISVPNILNIINRVNFLKGEFVDVMDVAHKNNEIFSEHIRIFSQNNLEKIITLNKFKVMNRNFFFPEKFHETRWKRFQFFGDCINKFELYKKYSQLFALGFMYVCSNEK